MIEKLHDRLKSIGLSSSDKILCAVSGGADSVVMLDCLAKFGAKCIVVHCNFQLRGNESDRDENFVKELANEMGFEFISKKFNTQHRAEKNNISVQMAAREIRFEWFKELSEKLNIKYIALGHNFDDQAETIYLNLIRGTGIKGLRGMRYLQNNILRPLLIISRDDIENYAKENKLKYINDSTNSETKYHRNKIRKLVFPLLKEINPAFKENAVNTSEYLSDVYNIFEEYIIDAKNECINKKDSKIYIDIEKIKSFTSYKSILFEIFTENNIKPSLSKEAINLLYSDSGKMIKSDEIGVLRDRNNIIINKSLKISEKEYLIYDSSTSISDDIRLDFSLENADENTEIIKNPSVAMLDADKLKFPLKLRKWKAGDKFKPLGMNNFKKLSDFFVDQKFSVFQKSEVWVVESGNDIVWIVGYRLDNRYKISPKTKNVFLIKLQS